MLHPEMYYVLMLHMPSVIRQRTNISKISNFEGQ